MATFSMVSIWQIAAPIEEVYRVIRHSSHWPAWWRGLERVEQLNPGDDNGIGRVYRYHWKSRLGYRLCFDIRVVRHRSPRLIEGIASGDLQGTGRWQLSELGETTQVRYEWRVRTTRLWMNLTAPIARPIFVWSHNAVMADGAMGLAQRLNARLIGMAHDE
ncbi:SRPBCC family protein [Zobellella aerophila]|uniref:Polyketide cyclase n=1 Tax=Zobellella aerophila TaxID=870480 RepID=A0ABP6V2A4_9GAMM